MIGKALQFNAGNSGVVLGDLDLQAPATVSFWIKSGLQADGRVLSQLEGPTTQSGSLRLSGGSLSTWNAEGWPAAVYGLSNKDVWQHVAVVYKEDGTVTGYLNGKKGHTAQSAFDFKGVKAGISARFIGQWGTPFVGALDDLRIYNRALEAKEITNLYPPELFSRSQAAAAKAPTSKPITDPAVRTLAREVATRGWILFDAITQRGDRDLFLARPDGSRLRNITNTPELSEVGGRFSPDGKKILYRRLLKGEAHNTNNWGDRGHLVIANADGSDPIPHGEDGGYPWASWSPDGKQIACLETENIRIYDVKSGKVLKELPRHGIFIQLFWSPDGKRLCGTANIAGRQWNVIAIDVATGKDTLLTRKLNCTSDWFQQDPGRVIYSNRTPGLANSAGWTMLMQATADGKSRTLVYAEKGQHIYCGCTSPDDKYVVLTRWLGDGGIDRPMAIIRLSDTPIIVPEYKELKAFYPDAREGPVLHLTNLPIGFEPHWTYADIKEK